jgi:hypothetical protein
MCVCGNGIDLTAYVFEILVFVCKILKLCGTYKGKIRGIEEKHAPLAENIFLGHELEIVLMERIGAKI